MCRTPIITSSSLKRPITGVGCVVAAVITHSGFNCRLNARLHVSSVLSSFLSHSFSSSSGSCLQVGCPAAAVDGIQTRRCFFCCKSVIVQELQLWVWKQQPPLPPGSQPASRLFLEQRSGSPLAQGPTWQISSFTSQRLSAAPLLLLLPLLVSLPPFPVSRRLPV